MVIQNRNIYVNQLGFENRDVLGTIAGLRAHNQHNGVQLEGLKRLSALIESG